MIRLTSQSVTVLVVVVVFCNGLLSIVRADQNAAQPSRRPIAIVALNDDRHLLVANQGSGSISVVDLETNAVVHEATIGRSLSDLILMNDPQYVLATDEENHELIAIHATPKELKVERRLKVPAYPVNIAIDRETQLAYVASLWSKTISVVDLQAPERGSSDLSSVIRHHIELPFSPREQLLITASDQARWDPERTHLTAKLVVADAFGSKLAVIDPVQGQVESIRELPAHAIRQLRLHPSKPRLLLTHQMLSRLNHTTYDDIHWGGLMANGLRSLSTHDVLTPNADLLEQSVLEYIGGPGQGAADPAGFVMTSSGTVGVAISGTNEFIVDDGSNRYSNRIRTGQLPTAVTLSADESTAYITNTLEDSIMVVSMTEPLRHRTISLGALPQLTAKDRGERLFHDASLSHDRWLSCASCHVDGHSNGLLNDNSSDESFDTPKRILTLRGVNDTPPYAWNGRFETLRDQITHSVRSTMQGGELTGQQIDDLEAYIRSLPPPPSVGTKNSTDAELGSALFRRLACQTCHTPPTYTSEKRVDVGIHDEQDATQFNPPSLRGVSQNAPYFHDGRAKRLEDVFREQKHPVDHKLSEEQLRNLIEYLKSL